MDEAGHGYSDSKASYIDKHKDEFKTAEKMNKGNEVYKRGIKINKKK